MAVELDIHLASLSERVDAHRNVHDLWSRSPDVEEHVRILLNSVQHHRAEWFVGCLEGRVVTSLASYPVEFRFRGSAQPGMAIGAVYTRAEFRGRGFAPQLIEWVEEYERRRGVTISLLYSDIDPDYYARLGYRLCPSWEGWANLNGAAESISSKNSGLVQFSPLEQRSEVARFYAESHASFSISIARNPDYWNYLFEKDCSDRYYWLRGTADETAGYVRLGRRDQAVIIRDWSLADDSEATIQRFAAAVIQTALAQKAGQVGGWLPNRAVLQNVFSLKPRTCEITMIKSFCPEIVLDEEILRAAEHFHEIDHV